MLTADDLLNIDAKDVYKCKVFISMHCSMYCIGNAVSNEGNISICEDCIKRTVGMRFKNRNTMLNPGDDVNRKLIFLNLATILVKNDDSLMIFVRYIINLSISAILIQIKNTFWVRNAF